ncbi:hypothetical protein [Algihabitans albus]|uniref:hypothetical protein n=1 Tax=Algihabitans albus TaxID=2164067 RepID=UPI0013C2F554|nr:hypothetical protein [Algihabitans albus]
MSKRAWVGLSAAVLVIAVAGGGYALLLSSANDAVERNIAQFRDSLPAGAVFTHGAYDVDLLERSVTMASPTVDFNGYGGLGVWTAAQAVVSGLEPDETETRAARILLEDVSLSELDGSLRLEVVEAQDVVIAGDPLDLRSGLLQTRIASLRAGGLEAAAGDVTFALGELLMTEVDGGKLGDLRFDDLTIETREPEDRINLTVGFFSAADLDLSPLISLTPTELAAVPDQQAFDFAVELGRDMVSGLTGYAIEQLRFESAGLPELMELAALRLTDAQIIDGQVVGGFSELRGLSIPLGPIVPSDAMPIFSSLSPQDRLSLSASLDQRYDPAAESLSFVQDVVLHDLFELEIALRLGNITSPPHLRMSELDLQVTMLSASLDEADAVLTDLGLLQPALEVFAAQRGLTEEELIGQLIVDAAEAVQALQLGAPGLQAVQALEAFLLDTGRLRIVLAPREETPLLSFGLARTPSDVMELLNPSFTVLTD